MKNSLFKMPKHRYSLRTPSFTDRFLASLFDFIIFAPIFSFILLPLMQNFEKIWSVGFQNFEFVIFLAVLVVYTCFLAIIFQAASLFWFRTTPGKFFFKLRVVNESGDRLSLHQSFLRSIFWVLEFFFLGIPFLEILSHPQRRAIHDRVSGTMVITIKEKEDLGPHPVERHFIRQVLMLGSVAFASWIFVFTNYFLKLAERGEFKKAELEEAGYLCEDVTSHVKKKEIRMEKALALYLADEISKECLLTEADFVFWQPVPLHRDWAYLAKGYASKLDSTLFEQYLNRVCEENESGDACHLAEYEADAQSQDLEKILVHSTSLSVRVKHTVDAFESGKYGLAEAGFRKLKEVDGFKSFALKGLMKTLWAENRKESSEGVYMAAFEDFKDDDKAEIAAWSCHEQMDQACNSELKRACEDLKVQLGNSGHLDSFTALALIRENECRKSSTQDWRKYQSLFQKKKDLYQYVRAIVSESDISPMEREGILEDLAFRKAHVSPQFLRRMAVVELAKSMKSPRSIDQVVDFLKERKNQDLTWIKTYQETVLRLASLERKVELAKVIDLPGASVADKFIASDFKIKALYLAKDFDRLKGVLATYESREVSRTPASAAHRTNSNRELLDKIKIQKIQNDLETYFRHKKNPPQIRSSADKDFP